jgi:hypothetical protein
MRGSYIFLVEEEVEAPASTGDLLFASSIGEKTPDQVGLAAPAAARYDPLLTKTFVGDW